MAIRDINKAKSTDMLALSCCAAADFCALFGYPTLLVPVRSRRPTRGPRHNQVPIQPDEHHALDVTCKHVAAQVDQ